MRREADYRGRRLSESGRDPTLHFTETEARNWARNTSMDFSGVFGFAKVGEEPTEFYVNGTRYRTRAGADKASAELRGWIDGIMKKGKQ